VLSRRWQTHPNCRGTQGMTISGFNRQCLRHTWHAAERATYHRLSE
jgi:hypothetical protein